MSMETLGRRLEKLERGAILAKHPKHHVMVSIQPGEDEDAKAADAIARYRADHGLDPSEPVGLILMIAVSPAQSETHGNG